jgi:hypothetical protein
MRICQAPECGTRGRWRLSPPLRTRWWTETVRPAAVARPARNECPENFCRRSASERSPRTPAASAVRLTSQRDVLVGQPVGTGLLAAPRDPPEQRPMRDAAELQPGLQGDDRAGELALEGLSLMRLTRPRAKITPGVWMLTKRWTLGRKSHVGLQTSARLKGAPGGTRTERRMNSSRRLHKSTRSAQTGCRREATWPMVWTLTGHSGGW